MSLGAVSGFSGSHLRHKKQGSYCGLVQYHIQKLFLYQIGIDLIVYNSFIFFWNDCIVDHHIQIIATVLSLVNENWFDK